MTFHTGTQATVGGTGTESATAVGVNRKTWYVGSSAPSFTVDSVTFPENGTLWLDTSTTPPTAKVYDGTNLVWVSIGRQDNIYSLLTTTTAVQKQRFVEWFGGKSLNQYVWNQRDVTGTGTYAMQSTADEGFQIQTGANLSDTSAIDFNNIRAYSHTASELWGVAKRVTASTNLYVGLVSDMATAADYALYRDNTGNTNKSLETKDGTTASETQSDVAVDTNWTAARIVCGSANIKLYINGVLKVTKTTNRPSTNLQPLFQTSSLLAGTRQSRIRYLEVYNT